MKRSLFAIALTTFASAAYSQRPAESEYQYFIVLYTMGAHWDTTKLAGEQLYFKEHSAHLAALREAGRIDLGARYGDTGMIILTATDEEEARAIVTDDKAIRNRLFKAEIFAFKPFYKGCVD